MSLVVASCDNPEASNGPNTEALSQSSADRRVEESTVDSPTPDSNIDVNVSDAQLNEVFRSPTPIELVLGYDPLTGSSPQRKIEDLIVTCMAGQGFEYIAFYGSPEGILQVRKDTLEVPFQGGGYGVVSALAGTARNTGTDAISVDPNDAIVNRLGQAERDAYLVALRGTDSSPNGCAQTATKEAQGGSGDLEQLFDAVILPEVDGLARSDLAYLEAADRWSTCMALQGVEFETRKTLLDDLKSQVAPLFEAVAQGTVDQAEIDSLYLYEIRVGDADLKCDSESGYSAAWARAIIAAEEQFLDRNPGLFE
jgi:hypothetical protein